MVTEAIQKEMDRGTTKHKTRGTVRNDDRLAAFADASSAGGADWGTCEAKWLREVIVRITHIGGAVTFGLSRDQGAHSCTLMLGDTRKTLWFNGDADLNLALEGVVDTLDSMG